MKLDKRTIEAFRRVNEQMKYLPAGWRFSYAYPVRRTRWAGLPIEMYDLYVSGPCKVRTYCIGYYRNEELLRAGVETVAEFLEGVV